MSWLSNYKASARVFPPGFFVVAWGVISAVGVPLTSAGAQEAKPVRSVTVRGAGALDPGTVESWLETRPGEAFRSTDLARIKAGFTERGYPFGKVDSVLTAASSDSLSVDVVLFVSPGKPAVVGSLEVRGTKAVEQHSLQAVIQSVPGSPFTPGKLEKDIDALLQVYEGRGYAFATIAVHEITFDDAHDLVHVAIVLDLREGELARVRDIQVEGNTTTRADVISKAARLRPGEEYRGGEKSKLKRRIEKLELFTSVSEPEVRTNADGTVTVSVRVVEGSPNRFDGVVGYVPGGAGSSGYVTGLLDVQFRNIFGTARKLGARWHRETQSSQDIGLRYREPWVAGLPADAELTFGQRKQDSTYVRTEYGAAVEARATDELQVGASFSSERVIPTEGFGKHVVSESRTTSIGFTLSYDSRDNVSTPTDGLVYRTEYHTGVKTSQGLPRSQEKARNATQRILFDLGYFVNPYKGQVIAARVVARDIRTSSLEFSDLFRLGGSTTLRGYREGQFLGSRVAWGNLEYRVLTGGRSFIFAFVDLGYVLVPDRPEAGLVREEIRKMGYGAGLRLDTPLGLIGLSLAFGQGDSFGNAKLHIQLVNEF